MSYTWIKLIVFCKGIHFHLKCFIKFGNVKENVVLFLVNMSLSLLNLFLLIFYVNN
jgi:hypothetical protein